MKRILYLLLFCFTLHTSFAQDDPPGAARLKEKMVEYIQDNLGLSKAKAEKFQPLYMDHLREVKQAKDEHQGDRLVLQQKIIELRLKFRDKVKPVLGEKRSNDVFKYEREFVQKVQDLRKDRLQENRKGRADKRNIPKL